MAAVAVLLSVVALLLTARSLTHTVWYQNRLYSRMSMEQLAVAARQEPGNPRALYYYGKALNTAGRYTEALVPLENAAGLDPDDARIRREWSTAQLADGYITGAFGQLTQFVGAHPKSAEGRAALGRFYVSQNSYERAAEELQQAVRLNPRLGEAWSLLSGAYRQLGNYVPARDAARQAVALRPNSAVDHMLLATLLAATNDREGSRREWEKTIALAPKEPGYLCGYSRLLLNGAEPETIALAEKMARRALALDPRSLEAALYLGRALLQAGKTAEAIEPLTLAAATIPAGVPRSTRAANEPELFLDPVAAMELARAYRLLGKEPEARDWQARYLRRQRVADEERRIAEAVRTKPESLEANRQRALFLARKGDVEGTAKSFAKVLRSATDAPRVLVETANALAAAGYGVLATPLARRAAIFSPNSPSAFEAWGNALLAEGQTRDAAVKYARAAGWLPDKMSLYRSKIEEGIRRRRERPTEAEKLYAQALALEQASLGTPINAGAIQELLERAIAHDPRNTDCRRTLVQLLMRRNELSEAERAARELLRLSPEDVTGNAMLAVLLLRTAQSEAHFSEIESCLKLAEQWLHEDPAPLSTVHYGKGVLALRRQQYLEAVNFLRMAAEEDPSAEATYYQLAQAERLAGNVAAADKAQAEVTRQQTQKQKALTLLNRIAEKPDDRQRYEEAIRFFTQNGMPGQASAVKREATRRFGES
jgi:tetratricopeptide (TPR) repeat protein